MSRHEGVSCDSCLRSNFRSHRYKCLVCYDYDLCSTCYESGATSTRHLSKHPVQCILTRSDNNLYYSGEVVSPEQAQSFTCPYCTQMGFSDATLLEHVSSEHTDTGLEVVCPVCAASAGGEPNLVTEDLAGHLTLEHRTGPRDLISFLDEPAAIRHGGVRRISHTNRILGGPRSRRANMHFTPSGSGLSTLSPQGRESVDLIAELQRRGTLQYSQMQQLQMQIQMERQGSTNRQLERSTNIPLRQPMTSTSSGSGGPNPPITPMQSILSVMSFNGGNASGRDATNFLASGSSSGAASSNHSGTNGVITNSASGPSSSSYISLNPSMNLVGAASNSSSTSTATGGPVVNLHCDTGLGSLISMSAAMQLSTQHHHNLSSSPFLMARLMMPAIDDSELAQCERNMAEKSQFMSNLLLSTMQGPRKSDSDEQQTGNVTTEPKRTVESAVSNEGTATGDCDVVGSGAAPAPPPTAAANTDAGSKPDNQTKSHTHATNQKSNKLKHGYGRGGHSGGLKNANFNSKVKSNLISNNGGAGSGGGGGAGGPSSSQQQQPQQSPPNSLPLQNVATSTFSQLSQSNSAGPATAVVSPPTTTTSSNPNKSRDLKATAGGQPAAVQPPQNTAKLEDTR